VALAGRVLQPHLARSTPWPGRGHGARPHHRDWMVLNTELSPATIHRYLDTADPFDEIRLRLFSHGVEPVACRPSVSGAQSSSGWEGRKLPRRRRADVPTRLRHPGPLPPGPRPGPQSLPMPDSLSLKGLTPPGSVGNATPSTGKDSCAISAGTGPMRVVPGPAALVHECSLPRPGGPIVGEGVDGAPLDASRTRSATSPPAPEGTQGSCRPPSQLLSSSSGPRASASCWSRSSRVICGISTVNGCVHRQLPVTGDA
jgi:hypothetical protein